MWTEDRVLPPMTFVCFGDEVQPEVAAMLASLGEAAESPGLWGVVLSVAYDCPYEERQPMEWLFDGAVADGLPESERARARALVVERLAPIVLRSLYQEFFAASTVDDLLCERLELHLVMVPGAVAGVLLLTSGEDFPGGVDGAVQMLFAGGLAYALPVFWSVPAMAEVEVLFDAAVDFTLDVVLRLGTRLPRETVLDVAGGGSVDARCGSCTSVAEEAAAQSGPRPARLRAVDLGAFLQSRGRGLSAYPLVPLPRVTADRPALPGGSRLDARLWRGVGSCVASPRSAARTVGRVDHMVGSVIWDEDGCPSVLLVRRRDAAIANAPLPDDLARRVGRRDRAGVCRLGGELRCWVAECLPRLEFVPPPPVSAGMVREVVEAEAVLGGLRAFGDVVGVELGEFPAV